MKQFLAASILLTACGNGVPDKVTIAVENEKSPSTCLSLDGSCSEVTTTTIDNNGVNTVKTEEPCNTPTPAASVTPVAVATPVATPAATPAPVANPAPFVPHFSAMVHPLPQAYDPVFSLSATVEFDINNNRVIDASEQFIVTFFKLADNSVVTTTAYGNQLQFFQEKFWYPNEFVNDMKPFSTANQPWEGWGFDSNNERVASISNNAYSFQAWAPLGNSDFRARLRCFKTGFINGFNYNGGCSISFYNVVNESLSYYSGSGALPLFSDGTYANSIGEKGAHISGTCLTSGSTGAANDRCFGDSQ
jgi:hypothetical protein